jgi:hypothetical protein
MSSSEPSKQLTLLIESTLERIQSSGLHVAVTQPDSFGSFGDCYKAGFNEGVRAAAACLLGRSLMEKQTLIIRVHRVRHAKHTHQYVRVNVFGEDGSLRCQVKSPVSFGQDPTWDNALLELQEVSLDDTVTIDLRNMDPLRVMPVTLSQTAISVRDLIRRPRITLYLEDVPKSKKTYKNAGKQLLQDIGTTITRPFSSRSDSRSDSSVRQASDLDVGDMDAASPDSDGAAGSSIPVDGTDGDAAAVRPVLLDISIDLGSFPLCWQRPVPSRFGVDRRGLATLQDKRDEAPRVKLQQSPPQKDVGCFSDGEGNGKLDKARSSLASASAAPAPANAASKSLKSIGRSASVPESIEMPGSIERSASAPDLARAYRPTDKPTPSVLHVMLMTRGTRGDVQPFVALARGLCEREGAIVTIVTELRWKQFVKVSWA